MVQEIGLRGRLDLSLFNSNVQSFMKSIRGMNKEVANVAKESTASAKSAGEAAGFLGVGWQRVKDIVTGLVVIDVFRQISKGLKSLIADAFDATAVFQSLMITMSAILARDYAKEFGVPVSQALEGISGKAQELLGWIRQIAVTTPFSVESIGQALAYGQAFGFNVAQSKRLTLATGEFVAGMGLTDEHMRRIIYNFGQMLASGRVLGRELRDLANNFVPIRDITQLLADQAGIPFEEMKKAMSEANVSAEQFISAFVQMAEVDFEGSMVRMSRTIRGVQQNISDFIRTLFGLELLGPLMERVAGAAADALDAAFSPEVLRSFAILGETLLSAFNQIAGSLSMLLPVVKNFFAAFGLGAPTVMNVASAILYISGIISTFIFILRDVIRNITKFVNTLSERLNTTFAQVVKDSASWGAGIVQALAAGMAQAVTYLIQVLNSIARLFTFWLSASSPPRLLPDLTKWGTAAMESWLKGWTSADFGLFNDIASVVTAFVRSLAHMIPETDLIPRIIGARSAIQRAVQDIRKFGEVTEASLRRIFKAIKLTSGPLKNFIKETFEFAKIASRIEAAKKFLSFDIKFEIPTKILGQTVIYLSDLVKLAKKFKGALGDALRSYVQALGEVRRANERVERAQKSLNDTMELYNKQLEALRRLQDKLRKKQDFGGRLKQIEAAIATGLLTDEEARRLELEKEEIIIQHKIAALENERDVAVDSARERLEAEQAIADAAEFRLNRQRRLAEQLVDEQLAAAKEQLDAARALIQMQIDSNNLIQEQVKLLERLAKAAAAGDGEGFDIAGLDFEGFTDTIDDALMESKEAIAQAIRDLRQEITERIQEFIDDITAPFEGIGDQLDVLLANISTAFETAKANPAIQRFVLALQEFGADMTTVFQNIQTFWEENGPGITQSLKDILSLLLVKITGKTWDEVLDDISEDIGLAGDDMVAASEYLVEKGPGIRRALDNFYNWLSNLKPPSELEGGLFGTFVKNVKANIAELAEITPPEELEGGLFGAFFKNVGANIADLIEKQKPAIRKLGQDLLGDLIAGMESKVEGALGLYEKFKTWIVDTIAKAGELKDEIIQIGNDIIVDLTEGIRSKFEDASGLYEKFKTWIQDTIDKAGELKDKIIKAGNDIITDLIEGVKEKFEGEEGLWAKFKQWILDTLDAIVDVKDDFIQAGKDLIGGLISGIVAKAQDLYDTVKNVIKTALGLAEEESEAESESKAMRRLGNYWMEGFQHGIEESAISVQRTLSQVFSDLTGIPENMQFDAAKLAENMGSLDNLGSGLDVRHLFQSAAGGTNTLLTQPAPSETNIQNLNVEVNAAYSEVQSEASIYYDVRAALAHITK